MLRACNKKKKSKERLQRKEKIICGTMCKGNQLVKNNISSHCAKEIIHFNANFIVYNV